MTAIPKSPIWTRLRNLTQQQQQKTPNNSLKLFMKGKLRKQRSCREKKNLNFAPLPLLLCEHDSKGIPRNRRFHALALPETLSRQRRRSVGPSELLVAPFSKSEVTAQRAVSLPLKVKPKLNTI